MPLRKRRSSLLGRPGCRHTAGTRPQNGTRGAISRWGTAVIETSDGIRDGTFPGAGTPATIDIITWWLSGTEDCE